MRWQPDPTFYPSPKMAMEAPAEKLAYVAMLNPDPEWPAGRNGSGRRRSRIEIVRQNGRPGGHAERGRRTAPLRLERLQFLLVPVFTSSAHGAPLPGRSGAAVVTHPYSRHQARSEESEAREGDRTGNGDESRPGTAVLTPFTAGPKASTSTPWVHPMEKGRAASSFMDGETFDVRGRWEMDRGPQYLVVRLRVAPGPRRHDHQRVGHAEHV